VSRFDFLVDLETFLPASYQYILYGMNAATDFAPVEGRYDEAAISQAELRQGGRGGREALKHLPPHRQLVEAYYARA
jgi:tryptophan halogenase